MTLRTLILPSLTTSGTYQAYPGGCDVDRAGGAPIEEDVFVASGWIHSIRIHTNDPTDPGVKQFRVYDCCVGATGRAIRGGNEVAVEDRHPYVLDTGGTLSFSDQDGSPFRGSSSTQGNTGRLLFDVSSSCDRSQTELLKTPIHCFAGMYVRVSDVVALGAGTEWGIQIAYEVDVSGATRKAARNFPSQIGGNIPL